MTRTARVDKDACLSAGRCVADAPAAFRFDDDELAEPVDPWPDVPDELLVQVARGCPAGAITLD